MIMLNKGVDEICKYNMEAMLIIQKCAVKLNKSNSCYWVNKVVSKLNAVGITTISKLLKSVFDINMKGGHIPLLQRTKKVIHSVAIN